MKSATKFFFALFIFTALTMSDDRVGQVTATRAAAGPQRLQFRVTTLEERDNARQVISEATIEGPPGTDFTIHLQGERFKMNARFLTDLISTEALKVRANLDTRRLYGYSERELPLYEEDRQSQAIELGFDEQIVLLPFGRKEAAEKIKIEITPTVSSQSAYLASGKRRPLEIDILKQSPNGEVSIQASRSPHNFVVEATLLENGVEVAGGVSDVLIEEGREIRLQPNHRASREAANNPILVNLTIDEYTRSRPTDYVGIRFNLQRLAGADATRREPLASRWAGVGTLGSEFTYDVSPYYLSDQGKKYELRFKIKLASNELAD